MKNLKLLKGFTLIELIVVIGLIGFVAAMTLVAINPVAQLKKANDARRKSDVHKLQGAFELYRADQAYYPPALPGCNAKLVGPAPALTVYLQKVPCDPHTAVSYTYTPVGGAQPVTYSLTTCLENIRDPQKDLTNKAPCNGTTNWSYTVNNP